MATFKNGDWVSITPRADTSWEHWDATHSAMTGERAKVMDVQTDPSNPNFIYVLARKYTLRGDPELEAWFMARHIIHVPQADVDRESHTKQMCDELQIWEAKKKKLLDDQLRQVFGKRSEIAPTPKKVKKTIKKKINLAKTDQDDAAVILEDEDIWEDPTQDMVLGDLELGDVDLGELQLELFDLSEWEDGTD